MTAHHTSWRDYKHRRGETSASRAAYERAGQAYEVGKRVRELREERSISRAELARRMGSTPSMIARLEMGGADPRLDTLDRVSRALDLELVVDFKPRSPTAVSA